MAEDVTIVQLREALIKAAKLVELHGEEFLPVFIRLETALARRQDEQMALDRAIALLAAQ